MRIVLLSIVTWCLTCGNIDGQAPIFNVSQTKGTTVVCHASSTESRTYIAPPKDFFQNFKSRTKMGSSIEVQYIGFPAEAQNAFQFAVDIWESLLVSPITIHIRANWVSLGQGTLGSASTEAFFRNFKNVPQFETWYPVALAEKIAGVNLNDPGEPDIIASFNDSNNWYFGTDLNPGPGQHDLVTVVLHEIAHGLGFIDTMNGGNGFGSYGLSGLPSIFDFYLSTADPDRLQLTDLSQFANPSGELGEALISNEIFFNSPLAELPGNILPKIFAPPNFNPGSSISHLDESAYAKGSQNSLMTPSIGTVEAIHNPGNLALQMFAEMGWAHTYIDHEPLIDTENFNQPFPIVAKVVSDSILIQESITLYYSLDSFKTSPMELAMSPTGNADEFSATIPAPASPKSISYFISADDNSNRTFTLPGQAPDFFLTFNAGPDTIKPAITHEPINFILVSDESIDLNAVVTDNFPLQSVVLEYSINNVPQTPITMTLENSPVEDTYLATLDFPNGSLSVDDIIQYRILATDQTSNTNQQTDPRSGFHQFPVEAIPLVQQSYQNDFELLGNDFAGNNFSISGSSGFTGAAIQSDHPYLDGDGPNNQSNYLYQLRIPIEVQGRNAFIRFKEVVLVEPGEPGTVFGDSQFWDYVIVEGSLDQGRSWIPMLDGYDSGDHAPWLSHWNSQMQGTNSNSAGNSSLFKTREIDMLQTFNEGDEILIRFRLFADASANGWGWVIDDLNIQGALVTSIPDIFNDGEFQIFPNPTDGYIRVRGETPLPGQQVYLSVINAIGNRLYFETWSPNSSELNRDIDLGHLPAGIYFLQFQVATARYTYKLIKSN